MTNTMVVLKIECSLYFIGYFCYGIKPASIDTKTVSIKDIGIVFKATETLYSKEQLIIDSI